MNQEDEKWDGRVKALYQEMMEEGVSNSQVEEEKTAFVQRNFQGPLNLFLNPALSYLSVSFCVVCLLFLMVHPEWARGVYTGKSAVDISKPKLTFDFFDRNFLKAKEKPVQKVVVEEPVASGVQVEWAASQVGSTMVYQKVAQEVPVTIVWVFVPEAGGRIS